MALSDYDHLAFDSKGKPCMGTFTGRGGYSFDLYKNWVYIKNADLHKGGGDEAFIAPTLAQMTAGRISLGMNDIHMVESKTLSRGSLIYISADKWDRETNKTHFNRFAGIVCSGYDSNRIFLNACKALKVNPEKWYLSSTGSGPGRKERSITLQNRKTRTIKELNYLSSDRNAMRRYKSRYVGVTKAGVKELISFLEANIDEYDKEGIKWLAKIRASKPLRYNQGNLFFANAAGISLDATTPSKAKTPTIIKLIKG